MRLTTDTSRVAQQPEEILVETSVPELSVAFDLEDEYPNNLWISYRGQHLEIPAISPIPTKVLDALIQGLEELKKQAAKHEPVGPRPRPVRP